LAINTHIITSHFALPLFQKSGGLVVEITDGTAEYNNKNYRLSLFYDLAKTSDSSHGHWRKSCNLITALLSRSPRLVAIGTHARLFGVSEANWRDTNGKGTALHH